APTFGGWGCSTPRCSSSAALSAREYSSTPQSLHSSFTRPHSSSAHGSSAAQSLSSARSHSLSSEHEDPKPAAVTSTSPKRSDDFPHSSTAGRSSSSSTAEELPRSP